MRANITVKFFLKKTQQKEFMHKIMGRIIHNRKKSEFATDIFILESDWNKQFCRSIKNVEINEKLAALESEIYKIKERLILEEYTVSSKLIKDVYFGEEKISFGIVEFVNRYLEKKKKSEIFSESYIGKIKTIKRLAKKFIVENYKSKDLPISRLNYSFITSFDEFLRSQITEQYKRPYSQTTIYKHHSFFRTILIQAFKEGYITKQPYIDFKLRKIKSEIKYLTTEELTRIEELELMKNSTLEKVRDIFLFSVYTGLRFRDAQRVSIYDIDSSNSTSNFIITNQEKTKDKVEIPIIIPTQKLIDKYKSNIDRIEKGKLLPTVSNPKVNMYLKVIGDLAKINLKLTHHVARHTCATTILLENNVPMEQVSKWLGHADISSTKVYGKITKSRLNLTAKKLNENY